MHRAVALFSLLAAGGVASLASAQAPSPVTCDAIQGGPVYRLRDGAGRVALRPLGGGATVRARVLTRVDLNADGVDDLLVSELDSCSQGGCRVGAFVRCGQGRAVAVMPLADHAGLRPAASTTVVDGVAWRDLVAREDMRGGMIADDARSGSGADWVIGRVYRRHGRGYRAGRRGAAGMNDECARALVEARLDDAQRWCEAALRNAVAIPSEQEMIDRPSGVPQPDPVQARAMRRLRGAVRYNLGRIAEARGDREAARDHYERSLRERPGSAATRRRLEAL